MTPTLEIVTLACALYDAHEADTATSPAAHHRARAARFDLLAAVARMHDHADEAARWADEASDARADAARWAAEEAPRAWEIHDGETGRYVPLQWATEAEARAELADLLRPYEDGHPWRARLVVREATMTEGG